MASKIIFVTGASGFIGSALVREAVAQGHRVRGLSRSETSDEKIRKSGGEPVRGDLLTSDVLARESANADMIFYFASAFSGDFSVPYEESMKMTMAAIDVIGAAIEGSNKPLIVASTALITKADANGGETTEEDPEDDAAFFDHKTPSLNALKWAKRGVRVAVIRFAPGVYGPGEQMSGLVRHLSAASGSIPIINGGNTKTSVVHVADAARLCLAAAEKTAPGECYNCVSDNDTTMGELLAEITGALRIPTKSVNMEEAAAQIGPMFAAYFSQPCRASGRKAKEVLGWEPKEVGILDFYNGLGREV